jgi:hypothetical protein
MKKKKDKKKEEMPEFNFKEFTPIADAELRSIIQADFLKIVIAESHFGKRQTLEELSKALDVPLDLLKQTLARMLQEVGISAANQFGRELRGVHPDEIKTDD